MLIISTEDIEDTQEIEETREIPIGKILALFTGFLTVVFVALVVYNLSGILGGTTLLSGNIQPLFDHQTMLENYDGGEIPAINKNYQTKINKIGKKSNSGIDNIVPIPEKALFEDYRDTIQGSITYTLNIAPDPMELCYSPGATIGTITADVYGNYEPFKPSCGGIQTVIIGQSKGSDWGHTKGGLCRIDWVWTPDAGCSYDEYIGTIVAEEEISLASNQWPVINAPWAMELGTGGYGTYPTIPCKKVDFDITTDWTGCRNFDQQGFRVILVQDI
ncbi:MAG: hypothetical protein ACFFDT_12920 [Candidatus Hodarchaeota archaeon]